MSRSIDGDRLEEAVPERFELAEKLGSGAFGHVYRAFDQKNEVTVALKTLHQHEPQHLYKFKREFRSLANISHPNLVDLYELVAREEIWFFTMSYVQAVDFRTAMRLGRPREQTSLEHSSSPPPTETLDAPPDSFEELAMSTREEPVGTGEEEARAGDAPAPEQIEPLDEEYLRETLQQLVSGVQALHDYGILHRDLKPGNVLVTSEGRAVILDFGLITELDAPSGSDREDPSETSFLGTPRYLAPELAWNEPLDEASDWYSVGVILYEVLTGRPPFEAETTISELYQKNRKSPPPIEEFRPDADEDLCRLCMDLLASDPNDRPGGREIYERLGGDPAASRHSRLTPYIRRDRETFVGRDRALETLARIAEETAEDHRPSIVDIRGDSGIGKTALAEQFLHVWREDHPETAILQGCCYEHESVPYKALDGVIDDLVPWLEELPEGELADLLGDGARAVARLFPVLRQLEAVNRRPDPVESTSEAQLRREAFTALSRAIRRIAEERLVIAFVDDVQWGDEDSVLLLDHLLTGEDPPGLMLVTTWRGADVETSPFLEPYLQMQRELEETVRLEELSLEELSKPAARRLARRLVADTPERGATDGAGEIDLDRIIDESGGNPLFVDELSRHTADTGTFDPDITGFDAILQKRLDDLANEARRTLDVLALAGQPLSRDLIRRSVGDSAIDPSTFSRLRNERLTRAKGAGGEHLEPYHHRIRDALVDRLSEEARQTIHLELARAFQSLRESDPETIGSHLEAAGRPVRAAEYFVDAADAAADNLAFDRAAQLLERALDVGDWSRPQLVALRERLGEMYASLGHSQQSAEAYFGAAETARGLDVRECRIRAVEQLLRSGEVHAGTDFLYGELEALGFSPVDHRALMLASSLYGRWKLQRRGFDFELQDPEALDRRRRLLLEALTMATLMHGIIDVSRGTYFHHHALPRALDAGYPSRIALLLCQQVAQDVAIRVATERGDDLLETARELIPHCQYEAGRVRAYVVLIGGMRDYFYSRWKPAQSAFTRAQEIIEAEMPGSVWWRTVYRFFECDCHHRMGAFEALRELVPETLEEARDREDGFNTELLRPKMALLALCADEPDRADAELGRAEREWSQEGYHIHDFWRERASIDTALYRGDLEGAWERMREEWRELRRSLLIRSFPVQTFAWGLEGRIAAAIAGESSPWRRWYARYRSWRARRRLRAIGTDCSEAFADVVEGQLAVVDGDPDRAIEALGRAQRGFDRVDMAFHANALRFVRARLSEGDEARDLDRRARTWMEEQGVAAPERMVRLVVPLPPAEPPEA